MIVGGGFAGLAAAWCLSECGVEVVLLEARDRFGGRVHSLKNFTAGRMIEGGGELIGLNHPAWLMFANYFGLGLSVITPEDDYRAGWLEMPLLLNGRKIDVNKAEKLFNDMTTAFNTLIKPASDIIDPNSPWDARHAKVFDRTTVADWIHGLGKHYPRDAKAALAVQLSNTNAVRTENQSLLGLLALMKGGELGDDPLGFWNKSEVFRCSEGNQALAECLATEILNANPQAVLRNHPVHKIEIHKKHAICHTPHGEFHGDCVVLAVPPSVWSGIKMSPSIPSNKIMSMGPALKYLSTVRSRFWIKEGAAPSGTSDSLGLTWEGTDNQIGGASYELSVFAGGECAVRALLARDRKDYFRKEIAKLYPGYLKSAEHEHLIPWPQIQHTMTGYSCPAPGEVTGKGKFLSQPFNERLFFAGEHTCMPFYGYMEGALQSGLRAAEAILKSQW